MPYMQNGGVNMIYLLFWWFYLNLISLLYNIGIDDIYKLLTMDIQMRLIFVRKNVYFKKLKIEGDKKIGIYK